MPINLLDYQYSAAKRLKNGNILKGGVGSGKSRTSLAYYCLTQDMDLAIDSKTKIKNHVGYRMHLTMPKHQLQDLYIITTARKRDTMEWEQEFVSFSFYTDEKKNKLYGNKIIIDSWNNIQKYKDVEDAFFIFDEQRVIGYGAWSKAFINISKHNNWILLSATPGDSWSDYIPVFIANGFYKNKSQFQREHCVWNRYTKYPKIDRYINTSKLERLRDSILIDMDVSSPHVSHHEDIYVNYDKDKYKGVIKSRWDPYKNEPIQQAAGLCYILRRITNEDESRQVALLELFEKHPRMIVFYNFDYELDILKKLGYGDNVKIAEWNGHNHEPIPNSNRWIYLVQYTAGAEGWNCITTDTIIFYSQNYSYKTMVQAAGRIDRLNSPYTDLYYYHLKSRSGIDLGIDRALRNKKDFNERKFVRW